MQDLYIISGIIIALLVVQLYLRYRVKQQRKDRENRKFGQ